MSEEVFLGGVVLVLFLILIALTIVEAKCKADVWKRQGYEITTTEAWLGAKPIPQKIEMVQVPEQK